MTSFFGISSGIMAAWMITGAALHAQEAPQDAPSSAGHADVLDGTDSASIDAQFYAGRHEEGKILANLGRRLVLGDKLLLDVTFSPTSDGLQVDPDAKVSRTNVYSGITSGIYESIYLLAGDKKYMLVVDSDNKPLAGPGSLVVEGSGPIIGQWNGTFPAPPANTPVILYLPGFSPIGPFSVPSS